MSDPLVVEVTRGSVVESRHDVDVVAVDASGDLVFSRGDAQRPTLPRSAIKPVQAVPVARVEHDERRLAIASSSHGGEPIHVDLVAGWLDDQGGSVDDLECGPHSPTHAPSAEALVAAGVAPQRVHNTCSGKHAGFLAVCRERDLPVRRYATWEHPFMRGHVTTAMSELCGVAAPDVPAGVDGCGIPVWTMALDRLAAGWARLDTDDVGGRIYDAMAAHPMLVAGTGRACTRLIEAGAGRVVAKTGAEGVFAAIDRRDGVAIAIKARDGTTRAAEAAVAWALAEVGALEPQPPAPVHNAAGDLVGEVRVGR
ncbi:MAG: asparaginase [Actinomycetota bacterium]